MKTVQLVLVKNIHNLISIFSTCCCVVTTAYIILNIILLIVLQDKHGERKTKLAAMKYTVYIFCISLV